jgi:hypothetical protein
VRLAAIPASLQFQSAAGQSSSLVKFGIHSSRVGWENRRQGQSISRAARERYNYNKFFYFYSPTGQGGGGRGEGGGGEEAESADQFLLFLLSLLAAVISQEQSLQPAPANQRADPLSWCMKRRGILEPADAKLIGHLYMSCRTRKN